MTESNSNKKDERRLWERLLKAWNGDKPACHLELATEYTNKYPERFWGWIALADVLWGLARYSEAKRALKRAESRAPKSRRADIYVQWGHLYKEQCELKLAERSYRRALRLKETTSRLIFLGAVLAKQGRFAEAKQCHLRAIRIADSSPEEAYFNLGLILRAERNYTEALSSFEQAVRLDAAYTIAEQAWKDVNEARKLRVNV